MRRAREEKRTFSKGLGFFMQSEGINCRRVFAVGCYAVLDRCILMKMSFLDSCVFVGFVSLFFFVSCIETF